MNKIFVLALPALLAISLVSRPSVAQPQALTAQEVLDAAAQKYAGFTQYQGTCSILLDGSFAIEGQTPQQTVSSASSTIAFERGKSLKVTGTNNFGGTFEALSAPASTTITVVGAGDKQMTLFQKTTLDKAETKVFLGGLTGVSGGGGATLPALLLDDSGINPLRAPGKVEMQPMRNLGETPCYIVTRTDEARKSVTTMWIEKDSFLLRRLEGKSGTTTTPAINGLSLTPEMLKQNPELKDIKVPPTTINYNYRLLVFATQLAK